MPRSRVTGVVLAAGISRRLGTAKQLLPFGDTTVLGATTEVARRCPFDQLIVTLGGAAAAVRAAMTLDGVVPLDVNTWDDYQRLLESVSR
jgi:molybdenum cofactor cytidylyltransferase